MSDSFIDIVFDGDPLPPESKGRLVETEDERGYSISAGEWLRREDGYWALRIKRDDLYANGVADGHEDAAQALLGLYRGSAPDVATALLTAYQTVRELQGWVRCSACAGTGETSNPSPRDLLNAALSSLGATVHANTGCPSCEGFGVVRPPTTPGNLWGRSEEE